jgi:hypothetical protein
VHVIVEKPGELTTHTWDPEGETEILAPEARPEQVEPEAFKPAKFVVLDKNGNVILHGRDLVQHKTLDEALVAARHWATGHISQGCVVAKILHKVQARHGEPIVDREDFQ